MLVYASTTPVTSRRSRPSLRGIRCVSCLLTGLLLLQGCASTPPAAASAETARAQAKAAYLAQDYPRTLTIVEPLAIAGEPWAQYTLGYMYHYGRGVAQDRQMAKQWIQRAADQGYAPAQQAIQRLSTRPPATETDNEPPAKNRMPSTAEERPPPAQTMPEPTSPAADGGGAPAPEAAGGNIADAADVMIPSSRTEPTPAPPAATETARAEDEATAPPAERPMTPPNQGDVKGRDWIAAQNPRHFTLQLIGGSKETAVIQFIKRYKLEAQAAYYTTQRNGQPWYAVVYGSYPDREAARQALARLPAALSAGSPWIRRFDDIQALSTTPK